jgi:predicted glycogen debranching enzyme
MDRYVQATGDRLTLRHAIPVLIDIIEQHLRGTRFNIGVDPRDGLLKQGADGYQLTWMDAKVEGWVVTPRRGKAVELNALFYNALRLLERWLREEGDPQKAGEMAQHAQRVYENFNRRFWNPRTGCLFDVVDGEAGDDPAIRPNMVFSISLPTRCWTPSAGAACWTSRSGCWSRPWACARWRRATPTTSRPTTATCARATPRTTRARCGAGWRDRSRTRG